MSKSLQISERFCLTSSLIPDCDCNSTSSVDIYFSPIICLQFKQYLFILLQKCKKVESLNRLSKYYWSLACGPVMMDREISCKGHCEKLSHFLDHVSHTVIRRYAENKTVTPPTFVTDLCPLKIW